MKGGPVYYCQRFQSFSPLLPWKIFLDPFILHSLTFQALLGELFIFQNDFVLVTRCCQGPIGCARVAIACCPDRKQLHLCTRTLTGPQTQTRGVFAEPDVESYEVNHHCLANFV